LRRLNLQYLAIYERKMDRKREGEEDDAPAIDPNDGGSMRGEKMVRAMKRRKRDLDEAVPRPPAELIDELAIHIADGRNVLFITGAGLSVSAGIPAFRSGAGAVWEENVVQYGTRKSLRKDPVEWHNAFWLPTFETRRMRDAKPTKAHDALAELAQLSPAIKVVTQNVDALHVGGGVPDAQLVEAHGRAGLFRCCGIGDATEGRQRCEESVANKEWYGVDDLLSKDRKALQAWWRDEGKPVTRPFSCPRCGAFLAPLSLLFDENYDSHFFFEADAWDGWLDDADAVVFAGTSFSVQVTREALRRCRDRRVPIYNFNVDEPEKTVALANAARLRRATALQTCDESFPQLEKAVRSKLRARGLEKPPSLPPPPPPGFLLDDASESSSEAPSSTDDRIILTHYAVPDGFRAVKDSELGRPPALLGQSAVERGDLYLIICCDDGDWMMGRIAKHKPNAKRFQYDVAWSETSRVCQQGLRLEDLFDPDGDVALPGSWRYLRKVSERASPERSRYLRSPSQRNLAVFNKPVETIETPGGRIATVIEKRGRGWLFVELDGDANDEGGAFERKCIRQRASPTNDITRASSPNLQGEPDGSVVTPPPKN